MDSRILTGCPNNGPNTLRLHRLLFRLFLVGLVFSPGPTIAAETLRIVSQNVNRLYDSIDDGNGEKVVSERKFGLRIKATARKIVRQFGLPDIIALQEVENMNVLDRIAKKIHAVSGVKYQSVLRKGNRKSGINTGFMLRPRFAVKSIRQLFRRDLLAYDSKPLFSRPPLYLRACIDSSCLSLVNLHLRSMRGLRSGTRSERVKLKRRAQANTIAQWIDNFQRTSPRESLMILGDFNALTPGDSFFDLAGVIRGDPDNSNVSTTAKDWIEEDLLDLTRNIPRSKRYSYIYHKKKQILDYMLVNTRFKPRLRSIAFSRIDYKFSDHAALIADFEW